MYRYTITRNGRRCCSGDTLKYLCDECQKIAKAQERGSGVPPLPLCGSSSTPQSPHHPRSILAARIATRQDGVPPPPLMFGKQFTPPSVQLSAATQKDGVPPPPDLEALIRAKGASR